MQNHCAFCAFECCLFVWTLVLSFYFSCSLVGWVFFIKVNIIFLSHISRGKLGVGSSHLF
jgi:hypothetical protein